MSCLSRHFFAMVVVLAICALPALYAWLNIYSNWDPYSKTGNLEIAVVNEDMGLESDSEGYVNLGDEIVESLRESESIGWVFLDTLEEATDGVQSGKYYAAISFPATFTHDLYDGIFYTGVRPTLNYYVNDKKNAIATKITDTAVATLEKSIDEQYIEILVKKIVTESTAITREVTDEVSADSMEQDLRNLRSNLAEYDGLVSSFIRANEVLKDAGSESRNQLTDAREKLDTAKEKLTESEQQLETDRSSLADLNQRVNGRMDGIQADLTTLQQKLNDAVLEEDVHQLQRDLEEIGDIGEDLARNAEEVYAATVELLGGMSGSGTVSDSSTARALQNIIAMGHGVKQETDRLLENTGYDAYKATSKSALKDTLATVQKTQAVYNNRLVPSVNGILNGVNESMVAMESLLGAMTTLTGDTDAVLANADTTLSSLNISMELLRTVIQRTILGLDDVLARLEQASKDERIQILNDFLNSDADTISAFFREPVQMEEHYIYPISTYGSGVAPFYTVLAIWVGMTILISIVKVRPEKDLYQDAKLHEIYFARYLTFALLSLIQTLVIVLGNFLIFHVQCISVGKFLLAALVISLTFSITIYTLAISFGDIGKALAIVIMVIQIAGSGGTYPIEALPDFFRNVYIFFPFPYAIDALRECVGGMYGLTYWWCLARLCLFQVAALFIGLVARVPFIGLFEFFEERMEDTGLM